MTSSRLVRGTKTRMFAFICLVFVLGALVYIFHGTQARLAEIQQQAGVCSQKLESLNAQMQVIVEYKVRLATSLNREKDEHKRTKETLEKKFRDEKEKWDKESLEAKNKYDALIQKNNILQGQLEDMKDKFNEVEDKNKKLETANEEIKKEMKNLQKEKDKSLENLKLEVLSREEEIKKIREKMNDLKNKALPESQRNDYLEKKNDQLQADLEDAKKKLSECQNKPSPASDSSSPKNEDKNVGAQPDINLGDAQKLGLGLSRNITSTPGINPMALGDMFSVKPGVEADGFQRRLDEPDLKSLSKKPTQESVLPINQPGKFDQNLAQIAVPPDHRSNTLQKPKTNNDPNNDHLNNIISDDPEDPLLRDQQMKAQLREPFIPLPGMGGMPGNMDVEGVGQQQAPADRDEEEEGGGEVNINNQVPHKIPDNYHGGDYDKEQPEEEDDEGEQIDYEADRSLKDGGKAKIMKSHKMVASHNGIMVNPK